MYDVQWNKSGRASLRVLEGCGAKLGAVLAVVSLSILTGTLSWPGRDDAQGLTAPSAVQKTSHPFGTLPLSFVKNEGQLDSRVDYSARGPGYLLALTGQDVVWRLKGPDKTARLKLSFPGANAQATAYPEALQPGANNYFVGRDPGKWVTDAPGYARVRYASIYPGIDLVYYGNQQQLEYDFVVEPGADVARIRLAFEGARAARVVESGDLVLEVGGRDLVQHKPIAFQERDGLRIPVESTYLLASDGNAGSPIEVGFEVGDYDHSRPLIIDPVLIYSTYAAGSGALMTVVALDAASNLYAAGVTFSDDFPIVGGLPPEQGGAPHNESGDAFILKLNPEGNELVYATYLAGLDYDQVSALKVDATGAAIIAGVTRSIDFPIVGGLPSEQAGTPDGLESPYLAKLSPGGNALQFSTFIGAGNGADGIGAIDLDDDGNLYVAGTTTPPYLFPIVGGLRPAQGGVPAGDAAMFIAKLSVDATTLLYSTYLSGSGWDSPASIHVDTTGQVYVGGGTTSLNLPRVGGLAPTQGGAANDWVGSAYYAKLNATGDALIYSSYLGSEEGGTYSVGLEVDKQGHLYAVNGTSAPDLPRVGGLPPEQGGAFGNACCYHMYIGKFSADGGALAYATYLAGDGLDRATATELDPIGNLYLAGQTTSTNYPQTNGLPVEEGGYAASDHGTASVWPCSFITEISPAGGDLIFSTYFCDNNTAYGLARADDGDLYIAGDAGDRNNSLIPIVGGLSPEQGGEWSSGFIARLDLAAPRISLGRASYSVSEDGASIDVAVTRAGSPDGEVTVEFSTADGTAVAGLDYEAASGTLTWKNFEMRSRTITIAIDGDEAPEGYENFTINLSNPNGGTLGSPEQSTVTIVDIALPDAIFSDGFEVSL